MTIEEINPELFLYEHYNANLLSELDCAFHIAESFCYCDASRLSVRPKSGEYALMIVWEDGAKDWCHITEGLLYAIKERIAFLQKATQGGKEELGKEGDAK